jgi:hypothetical protein
MDDKAVDPCGNAGSAAIMARERLRDGMRRARHWFSVTLGKGG